MSVLQSSEDQATVHLAAAPFPTKWVLQSLQPNMRKWSNQRQQGRKYMPK